MKKLLLIPVLAMTLSACSPQAQQKLVTIVADVQAAAVLTCKFEPTATTILSIVTANQSATVAQIADLICGAVKAQGQPTASRSATPLFVTINGQKIDVEGNFVR